MSGAGRGERPGAPEPGGESRAVFSGDVAPALEWRVRPKGAPAAGRDGDRETLRGSGSTDGRARADDRERPDDRGPSRGSGSTDGRARADDRERPDDRGPSRGGGSTGRWTRIGDQEQHGDRKPLHGNSSTGGRTRISGEEQHGGREQPGGREPLHGSGSASAPGRSRREGRARRAGRARFPGGATALLAASSAVVGGLSYGCALLMAHLLPPAEYTAFGAAQSLLTAVGVGIGALVPLPLARAVRENPAGSGRRRDGIAFAVGVSVLAGVVGAVVVSATATSFAPPGTALLVGAAAFAVACTAPGWGWLQGEGRFHVYAGASVAEVALRLGFSLLLVGIGAGGPLVAYALGALAAVWFSTRYLRPDLGLRLGVLREAGRWRETGGVAAVQLVVAGLLCADSVLVAALDAGAGGYQAVAALAKAPVFVATAAVVVSFPSLRGDSAASGNALRSFARLAVPSALLLAVFPAEVLLPGGYAASAGLLPWLALACLGYGAVSVLAVVLLAARWHARVAIALCGAAALVGAGLTAGWLLGGTRGVAVGGAAGSVVAALVALVLAAPLLRGAPVPRPRRDGDAAPPPSHRAQEPGVTPSSEPSGSLRGNGIRVLHLGFEDPAAPGAGGGSVRTHEVNRRLVARGHEVTVLTTRFPGCADRVQDGVRYVHIGPFAGRTRLGRFLGYAAALPRAVRRRECDLVVEDFCAPVSSLAAPRWTGRPTIGVVQWLNAREKAREYRVPVHWVERYGVRSHHRLVAVSRGIAERLVALNPGVSVQVVANGVSAEAFAVTAPRSADVVFVGRLEIAQKGLDLLLRSWALARHRVPGSLVLAGSGPDEERVRELVAELGLADRVRFAGWVSGADKFRLMAGARVVAVPSRYETFGIVALEALATGTPVAAFNIPCLREIVPEHAGELVRSFDVAGYADALARVDGRSDGGDEARKRFAGRYRWDGLAAQQERVYLDAVANGRTG
ncbi:MULTISPECIES: glycosyltransferase [Actinosynnema]|uniref:glycosyltransferase n=1 Tax=Actinosynnema TaxID=40566 RepID=UPI0020A50DE6|nr:glycosyltransferase [Actinosynnema pretiosum]MCP2096443.1 Glycosyltransferase involved in cell wall bisynthesis [Actinosynnema pretiosum]